MPDVPHVALLIETSRSYGRGLLRGIRRYLAEYGPWSVFMELRALDSETPVWLENWRGDGILSRTGSPDMAAAIQRAGVPIVELRSPRLNPNTPWVGVDNRAMGQIVAEHLDQRGFRHFGVCEIGTEVYFEQRRTNFLETASRLGRTCAAYHAEGQPEKPAQWERHQDDLAAWITSLPKPVGVMACTDQIGFFLLDACARAGVAVPEEVAVVGVENEESLCTMAVPTLSSVPFDAERIGYEAAALLEHLMAGGTAPDEPLLIPPLDIVARGSSDVIAISDSEVAQAVRFIRQQACDGITVPQVVDEVAISRSALERRMRAALGRSPNEEILRVRVERAKTLLATTDLSLRAIARRSGFRTPQYFSRVFGQKVGQTPAEYRKTEQS